MSASTAKAVWAEAVRQAISRKVRVTASLVSTVHRQLTSSSGTGPVHLLSASQEWYTPAWIVALVKQVFEGGQIDLDACSNAAAQTTVQARAYYTPEENGLEHAWHGCTYVNPPFGKVGSMSQQGLFLSKALTEHNAGHTTETILLLKAAVGYVWFHQALQLPHAFLDRKVSFVCLDGTGVRGMQAAAANPHGSVIVYLGGSTKRFCKVFAEPATIPGVNSWSASSETDL